MKKNILKSERVKKELTQKQIADKLGIRTSAYCDKENGKRKFTVKEALLLQDLFDFDIKEIFLTE